MRSAWNTPLLVIGVILLIFAFWWGIYSGPASADKLEAKLQGEAETALDARDLSWARVELHGQKAIVSGLAPTEAIRSAALSGVAKSMSGGGVLAGGVTVVKDKTTLAEPVTPFVWTAEKSADGITLTGLVPSRAARAALVEAAIASTSGTVRDEMRLARGVPAGPWLETAQMTLGTFGSLEPASATFSDTKLSVRGIAPDAETRESMRARLSAPVDGFQIVSDISGGALWSADLNADTLTLKGEVPDQADRQEILALSAALFGGEVIDEMQIRGDDRPGWMRGLRLGLPNFMKFQSGRFVFGDNTYSISGAAAESVLDYLQEDLAKLPAPYSAAYEVERLEAEVAEISDINFEQDTSLACGQAFAAVLASNKILFETGSARISRASGETLDKVLSVARRCDSLQLEISGHTDNTGDRDQNLLLSEQRAGAVVAYLVAKNFAEDRLTAVGFGPDRPIVTNLTTLGRAENRRIEITVITGEDE